MNSIEKPAIHYRYKEKEPDTQVEILKLIEAEPRGFIECLDKDGKLEKILPEVARLKNLAQPKEFHQEGDVFKHTLMLLDSLSPNADLRLKLAAIFHDLGKADTQEISGQGKITFHGHARKSAERVKAIAERFRFSDKLKKEVMWLAENHMLPISSDVARIKSTKLERMFLEDEELGKDLLALSRADALASIPADGKPNLKNIDILLRRIEQLKQLRDERKKEIPRLVTGKDLIDLGFKPGPGFSNILEEIREAQLNGKISTKEEGVKLAKDLLQTFQHASLP